MRDNTDPFTGKYVRFKKGNGVVWFVWGGTARNAMGGGGYQVVHRTSSGKTIHRKAIEDQLELVQEKEAGQ